MGVMCLAIHSEIEDRQTNYTHAFHSISSTEKTLTLDVFLLRQVFLLLFYLRNHGLYHSLKRKDELAALVFAPYEETEVTECLLHVHILEYFAGSQFFHTLAPSCLFMSN